MDSLGERRKTVVFNLANEEDRNLYLYAQSLSTFSGWVRAQLRAEIARKTAPHNTAPRSTAQLRLTSEPVER